MNIFPADADWLAALRYLENRSTAKPIGEFFPPAQEALSLRASTGLTFPAQAIEQTPADMHSGAPAHSAARPVVISPLLGLSGPLAALPYHYTEALITARRDRNQAPLDFFDIFNHRAQSLLYRALRKYRFVLDKERALARGGNDRYSQILTALCGQSGSQATVSDVLPRDARTSFAGLFTRRIRSARNLEQLLRHYFELDISIEPFAGRWVDLETSSRCRIGTRAGSNHRLGEETLLGRRSWQAESFFGVIVRQPDAAQLAQLAPGQPMRAALWSMVRSFAGEQYGFHIDIVTGNTVQCAARLHGKKAAHTIDTASATRLGWLGILGPMSATQTATIRINHPTAARMQR